MFFRFVEEVRRYFYIRWGLIVGPFSENYNSTEDEQDLDIIDWSFQNLKIKVDSERAGQ